MNETVVSTVPEDLLRLVLNAMTNLVVAKGHIKNKDFHALMVSRWEISTWCRDHGHLVPMVDVERALQVLTMPDSYARYYDSEYNNRKYRYYGLTKKYWAIIEPQHMSQLAGATA